MEFDVKLGMPWLMGSIVTVLGDAVTSDIKTTIATITVDMEPVGGRGTGGSGK